MGAKPGPRQFEYHVNDMKREAKGLALPTMPHPGFTGDQCDAL